VHGEKKVKKIHHVKEKRKKLALELLSRSSRSKSWDQKLRVTEVHKKGGGEGEG